MTGKCNGLRCGQTARHGGCDRWQSPAGASPWWWAPGGQCCLTSSLMTRSMQERAPQPVWRWYRTRRIIHQVGLMPLKQTGEMGWEEPHEVQQRGKLETSNPMQQHRLCADWLKVGSVLKILPGPTSRGKKELTCPITSWKPPVTGILPHLRWGCSSDSLFSLHLEKHFGFLNVFIPHCKAVICS